MHARKTARDSYFPAPEDDGFFAPRGDIVFGDTAAARRFAERINTLDARAPGQEVRSAEVAAMALVHEIFHIVIGLYRERHPGSFSGLVERLHASLGEGARETLLAFLRTLPPPAVYKYLVGTGRDDDAPERFLARGGQPAVDEYTEEVLLLWLTNQNPAYEPIRAVVSDQGLGDSYVSFVNESKSFFAAGPAFGPSGETLLDVLLAPSRHAPHSIFGQLDFIQDVWGTSLGLDRLPIWRRILWARDFLHEEGRYFHRGGPGPGVPNLDAMQFGRAESEPKRFSQDLDWMPRVVLIAKTVFVWLDQLSKKYERAIQRLDQVPDEELDLLASRGFTGLWLIGLFERSVASRKIKQMRGDHDAVASAYSLKSYDIAAELGGHAAYENLRGRAWARGIRLAADMVPNHVGIDADWVVNHPDWFIQTSHPPFPSYRFGGADLSEDPRVGIFIEEGYWSKTDAAVVFRRHDRYTGHDRFIYHGNDGTSMPWNDTAQLDYTRVEVRQAVIETILHVARLFPIIRFDAAMTLAKKHFQRLWFPLPGHGGGIPSRSDFAMTPEEFNRVFPVEFWREVVDTVAQRAPDTLLLAEAFWMMEGYFVRSLGMHRVYNSAFMNMLKREENEKYRATIKNVLDFDPEVLKRFVNFMNNPDEETAVAQFGNDDKYFGVCTLMSTMPGLPMFGHGQIEGFHEKYGMEYRRAKWDEHPNEGLIARHEREIFPLLKKRYLFSGVSEFAFYDFLAEGGGVDEDVFAYTNRVGDERALVLYNNKFKSTRGRIHHSVQKRREDGTTWTSVSDALGIHPTHGDWLVFRDVPNGLEYIRPLREVTEGGMFWELHAFKYHVFMDFRAVHVTREKPYAELAAELSGRGVPSMERAAMQLYYRPVHTPIREMLSPGHLQYLAAGWDPKKDALIAEARTAFEEKLVHLADGLAWMLGKDGPTGAAKRKGAEIATGAFLEQASQRYSAVLRAAHVHARDKAKAALGKEAIAGSRTSPAATTAPVGVAHAAANGTAAPSEPRAVDVELLLAWIQIEAALDMFASAGPALTRAALVDSWALSLALVDALSPTVGEHEANRRAVLLSLAATMPAGDLSTAMLAAMRDDRGRAYLDVHDAEGVTWLRKERFDELARFFAERKAVSAESTFAAAREEAEKLSVIAEREGYRVERIARALGKDAPARADAPAKSEKIEKAAPAPKPPTPPSSGRR